MRPYTYSVLLAIALFFSLQPFSVCIGSESGEAFINANFGVRGVSILAKKTFQNSETSTSLWVRAHHTPNITVEISSEDPLFFTDFPTLHQPIDYTKFNRRGAKSISHLFLTADKQIRYGIGGGVNQVDIYESNFFTDSRIWEYSGYGIELALNKRWLAKDFAIDPVNVQTVGEGESLAYKVTYKASPAAGATGAGEHIDAYSSVGPNGPFHRIEYLKPNGNIYVVNNSDFQEIGEAKLLFPMAIEVIAEQEQYSKILTIHDIMLNPALDVDLLEPPKVAPGAVIRKHVNLGGIYAASTDFMPTAEEIDGMIDEIMELAVNYGGNVEAANTENPLPQKIDPAAPPYRADADSPSMAREGIRGFSLIMIGAAAIAFLSIIFGVFIIRKQ